MKLSALMLAFFSFALPSVAEEATPPVLIQQIIQSEYSTAYNPTNNSAAELVKADSLNAEIRMRAILLSSSDEELKTCFALSILNHSIQRIEIMLQNKTPTSLHLPSALDRLQWQRDALVKYLRTIQKKKAEPTSAGDSATRDAGLGTPKK